MHNKKVRRRTFVDRQVQGALARRLVLHWCAFLTLGVALSLMLEFLRNPMTPLGEHVSNVISQNGAFVLTILCLTPVFLYDSVKLSHRFAGPILRLRRQMAELARGDEVKIMKTRPSDYWQDVIDDFNSVVERVQTPTEPQQTDQIEQQQLGSEVECVVSET
jgi:hypothetical protein